MKKLMFFPFIMAFSGLMASMPLRGMEINYRCISGTLYEIYVVINWNQEIWPPPCGGLAKTGTVPLHLVSKSLGVNTAFSHGVRWMKRKSPSYYFTENTPCPTYNGPLIDCSSIREMCYTEHFMIDTVDLSDYHPNPYADDWRFIVHTNERPSPFRGTCHPFCTPGVCEIYNLRSWYTSVIEAGLNNLNFTSNSSAFWNNHQPNYPGHQSDTILTPLGYSLCTGILYHIDQGAVEYEGDSLSYEIISPREMRWDSITRVCYPPLPLPASPATIYPADIPFWPPFTLKNPLPCDSSLGFSIDQQGLISFIPDSIIKPSFPGLLFWPYTYMLPAYAIAVRVTEWRKKNGQYKKVGFTTREITIWYTDSLDCKKDSTQPFARTICGADTLNIGFGDTVFYDRVRSWSISPDGSEFRLLDSSIVPARPIGIDSIKHQPSRTGSVSSVRAYLSEQLKADHKYYLILKKGKDLNTIQSECGYWMDEMGSYQVEVGNGNNNTRIAGPDSVTLCLPDDPPYIKIKVVNSATTKGSRYVYQVNGQTIESAGDSLFTSRQGDIKVYSIDDNGCTGPGDSVYIRVFRKRSFTIDLPEYCTVLPGELSAPFPGEWYWLYGPGLDTAGRGQVITGVVNGRYRLTLIDSGGCENYIDFIYDTINHTRNGPLHIKASSSKQAICYEPSVLSAQIINRDDDRSYFYNWSRMWENISDKPEFQTLDDGTYILRVSDDLGCVGVDSVIVIQDCGNHPAGEDQLIIPNIITPNGDGLNDRLIIDHNGPVSVRIFNRWGNVVYENQDYNNTFDANGLPSGVYYYLITTGSRSVIKGNLTVLR